MDIDRYQDGRGRRHYVKDGVDCLSVTTILAELEEDTGGLDWWKNQNDGTGDNAHWIHLFWYKTYRGTLCHYQALKTFEDSFESDSVMWGEGEREAMGELMDADEGTKEFTDPETGETVESTADEVLYSILKDHGFVHDWYDYDSKYSDHSIMDVQRMDQEWFVKTFNEICEKLGVNDDAVIRVEQFMLNAAVGYGGQCDLLYRDPDDNLVVADLKTSSGLRQKHRLQSVAYAKAVEEEFGEEVNRVEVWRIHPDTQTWEVHSHVEATEYHTTKYWYKDQYGDFEYESNEEMWEKFCELADRAADDIGEQSAEERLKGEHV